MTWIAFSVWNGKSFVPCKTNGQVNSHVNRQWQNVTISMECLLDVLKPLNILTTYGLLLMINISNVTVYFILGFREHRQPILCQKYVCFICFANKRFHFQYIDDFICRSSISLIIFYVHLHQTAEVYVGHTVLLVVKAYWTHIDRFVSHSRFRSDLLLTKLPLCAQYL